MAVSAEIAELRSHAIAEREITVKQSRESLARLYGQTFDFVHGLTHFGCSLTGLNDVLDLDDASLQARAKFIEACSKDPTLAHQLLNDKLQLLHSDAPGQPTYSQESVRPGSPDRLPSGGDLRHALASALSSASAADSPEVSAFSHAQSHNTVHQHRFESPAPQVQDDAVRPFTQEALDRHSPSFKPEASPLSTTGFTLPGAGSIAPSQLLQNPPAVEQAQQAAAQAAPTAAMAEGYLAQLPSLPDSLLRNRVAIGGLLRRKKEKDKERAGQQHPSSNMVSTGTELYKVGCLQSSLLGVRHLLGGPPSDDPLLDPKLRAVRPAKAVLTQNWQVAYQEVEMQRALEKVEELKAGGQWSFRQPKKQRGPHLHKTHWDYLLDEMRWLQTDFRQERRWKQATAFEISTWVLQWHAASAEERKEMCVKTRPPKIMPLPGQEIEVDAEAEEDAEVEADAELDEDDEAEEIQVKSELLDEDQAKASSAPVTFAGLITSRGPLFEQPESTTVISLADMPLDHLLPPTAKERTAPELLSGLLPDLSMYEPPIPPSNNEEMLRARRLDPSSPLYSRLSQVSSLMDNKPLLLSTLNPAKKRKWDGTPDEWQDLSDLHPPEEIQPAPVADASAASQLFTLKKSREPVQHVQPPLRGPDPPANAEQRVLATDWSEAEDQLILQLSKQYNCNWALMADMFNGATHRVSTDQREAWDMFSRWSTKFGPSAAAMQEAQAQAQQGKRPTKLGGAKKELRHRAVFDTLRRLQKKRETLPPKRAPTAPRTINLNAHETHTMPYPRSVNPMDLSRWKGERDAAHVALLRQQAAMRQQAQIAAAQAQLAAQQQAMAAQHAARVMQAQQAAAQHQQQARPASAQSGHSGSPAVPSHALPQGSPSATPRPMPTPTPSHQS